MDFSNWWETTSDTEFMNAKSSSDLKREAAKVWDAAVRAAAEQLRRDHRLVSANSLKRLLVTPEKTKETV